MKEKVSGLERQVGITQGEKEKKGQSKQLGASMCMAYMGNPECL